MTPALWISVITTVFTALIGLLVGILDYRANKKLNHITILTNSSLEQTKAHLTETTRLLKQAQDRVGELEKIIRQMADELVQVRTMATENTVLLQKRNLSGKK